MHRIDKKSYVLVLDQGATSSRALVFDAAGQVVYSGQYTFMQYFPQPGWVGHDPEEIRETQLRATQFALEKAGIAPQAIVFSGTKILCKEEDILFGCKAIFVNHLSENAVIAKH